MGMALSEVDRKAEVRRTKSWFGNGCFLHIIWIHQSFYHSSDSISLPRDTVTLVQQLPA